MFYITQSNDIERLFDFLLEDYQQKSDNIFAEFTVIVPAKVMGEWLKKQVADRAGISTLVVTEFWGRYQWQLMQDVLKKYAQLHKGALRVPDVAMLSKNVMQWRLFGYFSEYQAQILADNTHPIYPLLEPLTEMKNALNNQPPSGLGKAWDGQDNWLYTPSFLTKSTPHTTKIAIDIANQTALDSAGQQRLWQLAGDMASMLSRYMTYRPEWLLGWADNQPLPIEKMMADKAVFFAKLLGNADVDSPPDWLVTHYSQLEAAQRFLWQHLFAKTYDYRQRIEAQFWHALANEAECRQALPKSLTLFTIQMLPQSELDIMRQLARYMDIKLLHYNLSALFWADIVDKDWLLSQRFLRPETVYLKDYGHTLLSRFGKQSREVFAMLADLSGNEDSSPIGHEGQVIWQDEFVENDAPTTVLAQLQQDILMLEEGNTATKIEEIFEKLEERIYRPQRHWQLNRWDNSLSIHACHGMIRQLEVLRALIIGWLNYVDNPALAQRQQANAPIPVDDIRHVSDILILLPDLEAQQAVIETVFPAGKGADGYILPAKVTGVLSKDINQLWSAIIGYFVLHTQPTGRFERNQVFDWLMLPALYESYGLNQTQMARACDLLQQAGFIRGFDEIHLQQSLHENDDDYRFSFAYALERLVAGVLMPQAMSTEFGQYINQQGEREKILPLAQLQLGDTDIVAALCDIYTSLDRYRQMEARYQTAAHWLSVLEAFIHEKFSAFEQTTALKAIWSAKNSFEKNISANKRQPLQAGQNGQNGQADSVAQREELPLLLSFILSSMQAELASQQVSAEPAGVITFGRLGALRNLPYKLVVMLDMNLANFPKRDMTNRYDLMQVGLGRRGDRFREDDDLGAFLEAILSAKQACWLFYDRASMTQTQEQLPASPVQELIGFLQSEVSWQAEDILHNDSLSQADNTDTTLTPSDLVYPQLLQEWLVTQHPMLPFDASYFTSHLTPAEPSDTQSDKASIAQQLNHIKNAKKPLFPAAKIWHSVYEQLSSHAKNGQAHDTQPSAPVAIWQENQLSVWWDTWQQQKSAIRQAQSESQPHDLTAGLSNDTEAENEIENTEEPNEANLYIPLSHVITGMQKPAQLFLHAQQIYLEKATNEESYLEPLALDGLGKFLLKQFLLTKVIDSQADESHNQKLTLLPFDSQLPAGVKRYESLSAQKVGLVNSLHDLFRTLYQQQKINFPNHTQLGAIIEQVVVKKSPDTDDSTDIITQKTSSSDEIEITTDSELLLTVASQLVTHCTAQRVAVTIAEMGSDYQPTQHWQEAIITVNLPTPKDTPDQTEDMPAYWFNYLPTNGGEKYWLDMWLHHLCWQIARQTTPEQVTQNNGISLWQYSDVALYYLAPIDLETARAYLQDWLMVWQLAQRTVMVLPAGVTIKYDLAHLQATDSRESAEKKALSFWENIPFNSSYISEACIWHPSWQFLLGDNAPAIPLFKAAYQGIGKHLYHPLVAAMQAL